MHTAKNTLLNPFLFYGDHMENIDFEFIQQQDFRELSLDNMTVHLTWHADVDLDLMAFYEAKNGKVGALYSTNYSNGDMGRLDAFPFMKLSEDAGFKGGQRSSKQEELKIAKFSEIKTLYLVAVNFTQASQKKEQKFSEYDAMIELSSSDKAQAQKKLRIRLDATSEGNVAVFAKIENTNSLIGAMLSNMNQVLTFSEFQKTIPGTQALNLKTKVILREKGQRALVASKGATVKATLNWKTSIDFDLHCFYKTKKLENAGFFQKMFGNTEAQSGHISFREKGTLDESPYIKLDKDAGIGDKGGDNEENIYFGKLENLDRAWIAVNTFNKPNSCFANYDAKVTLHLGEQEIIVPLKEKTPGAWCVIAELVSDKDGIYLVNINQTQSETPALG
jgi:uncharacterized protein involved in tellurium resistance